MVVSIYSGTLQNFDLIYNSLYLNCMQGEIIFFFIVLTKLWWNLWRTFVTKPNCDGNRSQIAVTIANSDARLWRKSVRNCDGPVTNPSKFVTEPHSTPFQNCNGIFHHNFRHNFRPNVRHNFITSVTMSVTNFFVTENLRHNCRSQKIVTDRVPSQLWRARQKLNCDQWNCDVGFSVTISVTISVFPSQFSTFSVTICHFFRI